MRLRWRGSMGRLLAPRSTARRAPMCCSSSHAIAENSPMEKQFDLVIKNARVVRPNKTSVDRLDMAVRDGKIARLAPEIEAGQSKQIFDAKNRLVFPGCVDAHMHIGIYAPL